MTIEIRWRNFVETMSNRLATFDKVGAEMFKQGLLEEPPPNETALEWSIAYVTFQHYNLEFIHICRKQGRDEEAALVATVMEALNDKLLSQPRTVRMPREFVKEVKF